MCLKIYKIIYKDNLEDFEAIYNYLLPISYSF